jgi:hypothetical protein
MSVRLFSALALPILVIGLGAYLCGGVPPPTPIEEVATPSVIVSDSRNEYGLDESTPAGSLTTSCARTVGLTPGMPIPYEQALRMTACMDRLLTSVYRHRR